MGKSKKNEGPNKKNEGPNLNKSVKSVTSECLKADNGIFRAMLRRGEAGKGQDEEKTKIQGENSVKKKIEDLEILRGTSDKRQTRNKTKTTECLPNDKGHCRKQIL